MFFVVLEQQVSEEGWDLSQMKGEGQFVKGIECKAESSELVLQAVGAIEDLKHGIA